MSQQTLRQTLSRWERKFDIVVTENDNDVIISVKNNKGNHEGVVFKLSKDNFEKVSDTIKSSKRSSKPSKNQVVVQTMLLSVIKGLTKKSMRLGLPDFGECLKINRLFLNDFGREKADKYLAVLQRSDYETFLNG